MLSESEASAAMALKTEAVVTATVYCHHILHIAPGQGSRWPRISAQGCLLKMATGHRQLWVEPPAPPGGVRGMVPVPRGYVQTAAISNKSVPASLHVQTSVWGGFTLE